MVSRRWASIGRYNAAPGPRLDSLEYVTAHSCGLRSDQRLGILIGCHNYPLECVSGSPVALIPTEQ